MHHSDWDHGRSFASRFRLYIESMGLSQAVIARQLHSNQTHISRLANGEATPSYADIGQMVAAWGRDVTLRLLFDDRHTSHGLSWIEPWPVFWPGIDSDDTAPSPTVFREFMHRHAARTSVPQPSMPNQRTLLNTIKQCFLSGSVRICDVDRNTGLEQTLKDKYGLRDCIVADITLPSDPVIDTIIRAEAVAFLAARDAIYSVLRSQHVGITGGSPIYRFIDLLMAATDRLKGVHWWSLISTYNLVIGGAPAGTAANDAVARLAYAQPSSNSHPLPFLHAHQRDPAYQRQAVDPEREEIRFAEQSLQSARQVETAFLSVGSLDLEFRQVDVSLRVPALSDVYNSLAPEDRAACVGDILLRAVDGAGNVLGDPETYARFVYSVNLDDLRQIVSHGGMVWILAERPGKAAVVRAALVSRLANALVIDRSIADQLISERFIGAV